MARENPITIGVGSIKYFVGRFEGKELVDWLEIRSKNSTEDHKRVDLFPIIEATNGAT